jgi:hypothetical protein
LSNEDRKRAAPRAISSGRNSHAPSIHRRFAESAVRLS